jgi:DUF4097 and DUF4098 domain-containing protein YvlB
MREKTVMNKNLVIALAVVAGIAGCAFNLQEVSLQKTAAISSSGVHTVDLSSETYTGDITVNGLAGDSIEAKILLQQLVTSNSEGTLDLATFSIDTADSVASVSLSYGKSDWETIQAADFSLAPDKRLALTIENRSGNVTVAEMSGYITVGNVSGNITVETLQGATVSDTSGNIEATVSADTALFTGFSLRTVSGNIRVRVPSGFKADLSLNSKSGNKTAPGNNTSHLNGGNPARMISCSTTSGNITVEEF